MQSPCALQQLRMASPATSSSATGACFGTTCSRWASQSARECARVAAFSHSAFVVGAIPAPMSPAHIRAHARARLRVHTHTHTHTHAHTHTDDQGGQAGPTPRECGRGLLRGCLLHRLHGAPPPPPGGNTAAGSRAAARRVHCSGRPRCRQEATLQRAATPQRVAALQRAASTGTDPPPALAGAPRAAGAAGRSPAAPTTEPSARAPLTTSTRLHTRADLPMGGTGDLPGGRPAGGRHEAAYHP